MYDYLFLNGRTINDFFLNPVLNPIELIIDFLALDFLPIIRNRIVYLEDHLRIGMAHPPSAYIEFYIRIPTESAEGVTEGIRDYIKSDPCWQLSIVCQYFFML